MSDLFEHIQSQLGGGWVCGLISTLTPGIIRLQLMSPGEFEPGWRKCIEASTFEKALEKASKFTNSITWQEYESKVMNQNESN